ncbi:hypothetical protein PENTCL1PPCAC_19583, partial [Pristionchus entomophagus]
KCGFRESDNQCYGCDSSMSIYNDSVYYNYYCSRIYMSSIDDLMRPQSCVRFQRDKYYNYTKCRCNTTDFCAQEMLGKQTLNSDKVTCYVDTNGNDTCKGDLCYVTRQLDWYIVKGGIERGCITNNETLFAGLYQVGSMKSVDLEIAICNVTLCNADVNSAKKNRPGT